MDATSVAREVGMRLGWPVYDRELLERISSDIGVDTHLLERVDEQRGNWLGELFQSLMGVPYVAECVYVHRLVKIVLALGGRGACVIVGRGAAFILPPSSTFRVRLIAPREFRSATLRRLPALHDAVTRSSLAAQDQERFAFVRDHFHHDPEAPHHYDLLLNVERFSAVECANLILEGLGHWRDRNQTA